MATIRKSDKHALAQHLAIRSIILMNYQSVRMFCDKNGIDRSTFNPSKRKNADGKYVFPSGFTVSRVLTSCKTSYEYFGKTVDFFLDKD